MPIYEFGCRACRRRFEKIVAPGGRVPASASCPRCRRKAARLPSRFAVAGTTSKSGGADDWDDGRADDGGEDLPGDEGDPGDDGRDLGEGEDEGGDGDAFED